MNNGEVNEWEKKGKANQKKERTSLQRSEIVWLYDSQGLETRGKAAGFGAS